MKKSLKKNYLYNLLFQLITIIVPFITAPYLARVLGVNAVGIASYTLSIVSYFIIFSNLGISSFGQREIAMYQDNKEKYSEIFWNLVLYQLIIGIFSLLIYLIFINIKKDFYPNIMFILTTNLIANIFDITWFYRGMEEYKYISLRNVFVKVLFVIGIFVFVKTSNDLNLYLLLNGLSLVTSTIIVWIGLYKKVNKPRVSKLDVLKYWKDGIVYFIPQIALQIYTVLDKTMLGIITGNTIENGYYEQAHKIVGIITTLVTSLNAVMLPRMSYLYMKNENDKIRQLLRKTIQYTCAIALPLALGITAISSGFVEWFFGPEYAKVKILLPLFSPLIIIIAISGCIEGQCLVPCGMRKKSSIALWCGAIVNFLANIFLIKFFQSIGAVIASVIAEFVVCSLFLNYANKYIKPYEIFKSSINYIVSSIIMFVIVFFIDNYLSVSIAHTIIEIMIGGCIYLFILLLLKDELISYFINIFVHNLRRN